MLKRFESISLGQGQGPKAHGVGRDGFFSVKNDRKHAVYCVPQGFIFGVYNCCFMLFPHFVGRIWSVLKMFWIWGFVVFFGNDLAFEDEQLIANVAMWNGKNWNPPGEIQKKSCHVGTKKNPVQSRYFLLDVRFSFPGHEADRNSTRWWWLGTLIQLPLGADAMCGNSRGKTVRRADYVHKLGANEKKHTTKSLFFHFRERNNDKWKYIQNNMGVGLRIKHLLFISFRMNQQL